VIQKHDASRLHYDLRLELGGTLKSWAVPNGPSLDPAVKSLAVHVEDHPLDYAGFEGVIPEGQYGGGTVMVWDQGSWQPEGDPAKAYRSGKLKFTLKGQKLHGSWALVRMGGAAGEDGKNWLLIKHRDAEAKSAKNYDVLKKEPLSVLSGRDLEEIAADGDRVWSGAKAATSRGRKGHARSKPVAKRARRTGRRALVVGGDVAELPGARRRPQPMHFKPQLATLADVAPRGPQWLHELKFDGYRILAHKRGKRVRLITRNDKDWTHRFGAVARAVGGLPVEQAIFDGEVVALDDRGRSNFQQLQNVLKQGDEQSLAYYLFDLPQCDGYDLTATPLGQRKQLLKRIVLARHSANDGVLRFSDHIDGEGDTVVAQACKQGMEGIVCKRADSPYQQARSRDWLKVKCSKRQEFVIGGYTRPTGSRVGFGALLLGYHDKGRLRYCGRVGTGFNDDSLRELTPRLKSLRTKAPPFETGLTTATRRGATWVRPDLVCEVEFTEWTSDGRLRHPSFQGLREDKPPSQITREEAAMRRGAQAKGENDTVVAGVRITHPERVVYPEQGVTKLDLAKYYDGIAERMLPHVADRPLTLVRCPAGARGQCFYQKHLAESAPDSVHGVMITEKTGRQQYVTVDDAAGLVSLVQMGVLEIHPWGARADKIEVPDRLVFDFDPGDGVAWPGVVGAAGHCRDRLAELGLESFLRTSGGKGLHVVVPLARRGDWEQLKTFAKAFADDMVGRAPDRYIATMSKAKRRGKIFVDYLRNQRGATAIATFSTRARPGAPVATPLAWSELSDKLRPNQFTVANLPARLAKQKTDPWADFFSVRQSITRAMVRELL